MNITNVESLLKRFAQDESGATAVEYAVLAALITGAIIVAVGRVGTSLQNAFNNVATQLENRL